MEAPVDVDTVTDEPTFSDDIVEDASDIPIDAVKDFLSSGSVGGGFIATEDDGLLRVSVAEDVDFDQDDDDEKKSAIEAAAPAALGKGHRVKKQCKLYGGADAWSLG
jgi:hypothetical protein